LRNQWPAARRKIDRISLVPRQTGLADAWAITRLGSGKLNNHLRLPVGITNITASVCSFRTGQGAQVLIRASNWAAFFNLQNGNKTSAPFEWHSRQRWILGLMEPGKWSSAVALVKYARGPITRFRGLNLAAQAASPHRTDAISAPSGGVRQLADHKLIRGGIGQTPPRPSQKKKWGDSMGVDSKIGFWTRQP